MKQQPTVLYISKISGDRYRFLLIQPGDLFAGPIQREWVVPVQYDAVVALCKRINNAVDNANINCETQETADEARKLLLKPFENVGKGLYDTLLSKHADTQDLRGALLDLPTPLLISTDDPEMYWELLHDGDEFLGLKYKIGRRLITRNVPSGTPRSNEGWRCLMIADPNPDEDRWALPETAKEAAQLRAWLIERDVNCDDYLQGRHASFDAVLGKLLEHSYDIIHYAGHVVQHEQTGEYCLRLHGGQLFAASTIKNLVTGAPIAFLNGCKSGKAVAGLTDAFLEAGAQVVVGSTGYIPDEGARAFAEKFYESMLRGEEVGEAMRAARKHAMKNPKYAAAWACFLMYGDPCLRIELRKDELQELLQGIGLSRSVLEISCGRVVEQAFEYGRYTGGIGTLHLFAAMINGESPHLRGRLRELNAPEELSDSLHEFFNGLNSPAEQTAGIKFSDNTKKILLQAHALAQAAERKQITELDLVKSFAVNGGGHTGEILRELGVDVKALDPDWVPPPLPPPVKCVGPLCFDDCTAEAWQILMQTVGEAQRSKSTVVGTPHLFAAMHQAEQGPLTKALSRLGIKLKVGGSPVRLQPFDTEDGKVGCSQSVSNALLLAQAIAAAEQRGKVTPDDLLTAFVQQGGGQTGKWLRRKGVVLESLISKAFLDNGELDMSRFDEAAQRIIEGALECARRKGDERLGRDHLLYAMLATDDSLLQKQLRAQGKDAEQLANSLYVAMPTGSAVTGYVEAKAAHLSRGLVRIFCAAEADMKGKSGDRIEEAQLLRAFLDDGGGWAGQFLVEHSVKLNRLG